MQRIILDVDHGRFVTTSDEGKLVHRDVAGVIEYLHDANGPYRLDSGQEIPRDFSSAIERVAVYLNGHQAVFVGYSHRDRTYSLMVRHGKMEEGLGEREFLGRISQLRVGNQKLVIANTGVTASIGPVPDDVYRRMFGDFGLS